MLPPPARPRRCQLTTLAAALAGLLVALGPVGCGEQACNGTPFVARRGSPIIERVKVSQPVPDNPWVLTLAVTFRDDGGDLGDGMAFVYFGGSQQVARSFRLRSYFETTGLALDATSGTFGLTLPVPPDSLGDGTQLQVGLQLEDASASDPHGLYSNCFRMNLQFAVQPIVQAWHRLARRVHHAWTG